jgi:hypothetical protein
MILDDLATHNRERAEKARCANSAQAPPAEVILAQT